MDVAPVYRDHLIKLLERVSELLYRRTPYREIAQLTRLSVTTVGRLAKHLPETNESSPASFIESLPEKLLRDLVPDWALQVKNPSSTPSPDLLSEFVMGEGMAKPEIRKRDRSGVAQEYRVRLVGMQTFVEEETRDKFNELATAAGMSTVELLRHMVEQKVAEARIPDVEKARKEAREHVLKNVTPGTSKRSPS